MRNIFLFKEVTYVNRSSIILDAQSGNVQCLWFVFLQLDPHRGSSLPTLHVYRQWGSGAQEWHSPMF